MKVNDTVMFGEPNGSFGIIESENHYGGFYVRWYYGKDVKGEYMTAFSSCKPDQLMEIDRELFLEYRECRGFDSTQHTKIKEKIYEQLRRR